MIFYTHHWSFESTKLEYRPDNQDKQLKEVFVHGWDFCLLPPQRSSKGHSVPHDHGLPHSTFVDIALQSFHVAFPLPQKGRWLNVGDRSLPRDASSSPELSFYCPKVFSISGLSESYPGVTHISKSSGLIYKWWQTTLSDPEPKRLFEEGKRDLEHRHHYLISSVVILLSFLS